MMNYRKEMLFDFFGVNRRDWIKHVNSDGCWLPLFEAGVMNHHVGVDEGGDWVTEYMVDESGKETSPLTTSDNFSVLSEMVELPPVSFIKIIEDALDRQSIPRLFAYTFPFEEMLTFFHGYDPRYKSLVQKWLDSGFPLSIDFSGRLDGNKSIYWRFKAIAHLSKELNRKRN